MIDALLFGYGGMAGGGSHISRAREVCNKYFEQVSDGEMQTHVYTYDHQLEED
jgi:hypothetical protein